MTPSRRQFLTTTATTATFLGLGIPAACSQADPSANWRIGYSNAPAEGFDPAPMRLVYGKPPADLNGTLYRNGPAQFVYGEDDYTGHWFDGDGMVQRIAIGDGQAVHSGRFVQTAKRKIEQEQGRMMAPGFGTAGLPDFPIMGPDDVNMANTSVIVVNGELLALWEAGSATSLDASSLEMKGHKVWRDDLAGMPFLAHPKTEPDGTVWNLAIAGPNIGVYKIGKAGDLNDFGMLNIDTAAYIHDWAMTEQHLIIMVQPWIYGTMRPPFASGLNWEPERGFKFLIVDKDDFSKQRWAQGPARSFYHTGAAWEESDGTIRIDAVMFAEPVFGMDGGMREIRGEWTPQDDRVPGNLTQIIIPPTGDAEFVETGIDGEFPQVDARRHGAPRSLTALASRRSTTTPGFTSLSVHNWKSARTDTFDFGESRMVEEFLFVPKSGSNRERDSWLVGPVLNLKSKTTDICVFDAANVSDGPVCIWRGEHAWPLGFHGTWA